MGVLVRVDWYIVSVSYTSDRYQRIAQGMVTRLSKRARFLRSCIWSGSCMQLGADDSRMASESRPGEYEEGSIHHTKSRLESYWRISDLGALRLCLCLCCEAESSEERSEWTQQKGASWTPCSTLSACRLELHACFNTEAPGMIASNDQYNTRTTYTALMTSNEQSTSISTADKAIQSLWSVTVAY